MQLTKSPATIALSVWLIAIGLLPLLHLTFPASDVILALLAIAAGVLLILGPGRQTRKLGVFTLAAWLIATGLLPLLKISFPAADIILTLMAIAAGVLLLLGR